MKATHSKKKIFLIQKWEASLFPMAREHKREVIQVCQVKVDGCLVFKTNFSFFILF